ncbi:restriction endonuclease subunit S [Ochrovirga pacifica]|uniref:restriction endonuclease subunit S n=1 Tax=Ochrovirga pacifica TaxID=1042376 RepID=UPI0002557FF5|nr:restriction endonuclease subunit S [Ochrovirga pacifica]
MKTKTLEEITLKIGSGATPKGGQSAYKNEGISLIRSQNVYDFSFSKNGLAFIDEEQAKKLNNVTVEEGDILFNITGDSIARTCLVPNNVLPARVNQHVSIIRCKPEYDSRFVNYFLINLKPYLMQICGVGGTRNALTKEAMQNLKINIPTTQKQIAKVLSDLDAKIEINNKINAELEAMAKTLYDYWFVQFDFPDANGKPYKSSGGKMEFNEDIKREIPEGWEVNYLIDEMDLQYGFPFSTTLFNSESEGVPVIRIRDILNCTISNFSTEEVHEKYKLEKGDLLVGMDGNFHINYWNKEGCYLNQRCLRIRTSSNSISEIQTKYSIEPYIKAREKNVSRTTVAHLSARDINDLKILKATDKIQQQANIFFKSTLSKIISNNEENQKLSELRDWLLPMLMNGQVTIGGAEKELGMVAEESVQYGNKK